MTASMVRDEAALESLVARVADEFVARLKQGERPEVEEYATRHPEHAAVLREVLAALQLVERSAAGAGAEVSSSDEPVPGYLGDFRILREVGRGGMGVVYEAEQVSLRRRVALKVLPFAATMDPRQLQRFQNEARAAASLHHEHIVPVYAVGQERSVHFYAMQFIDGRTLAQVIADLRAGAEAKSAEQKPELCGLSTVDQPGGKDPSVSEAVLSPATTVQDRRSDATLPEPVRQAAFFRRVAEWGIDAAEALEHAHSVGIVHRDVKPGNLMIDGAGKLWVTDFGLAQTADSGLTLTGDLLGTLRYMSPEQALAKHGLVDHRTDVYSLGVTLYELLTLRPAVEGEDRQEILHQVAEEEPPAPRVLNRALPRDLETIVLKALAKEPLERYATAKDLAEDLRRFAADEPVRARRPTLLQRARRWGRRNKALVGSLAAGLLLAVMTLAGSVGWVLGDRESRRTEAERKVVEALAVLEPGLRQGNPYAADVVRAARQAEAQLDSRLVGETLRKQAEQLLADLAMLARLQEIRLDKAVVKDGHFDIAAADDAYAIAFREYGIDVTAVDAAAQLRRRAIAVHVAAALDDWALARKAKGKEGGEGWQRLLEVAREADPDQDEWRNALREVLAREGKKEELEGLAARAPLQDLPASTLSLLGNVLLRRALPDDVSVPVSAARVLREGQGRFPADFWLNHELALTLARMGSPHLEEAIGFYRAALALRPESPGVHLNLGVALHDKGQLDEAIAENREALRLNKDYAKAHNNLGNALRDKGQLDEAIAEYREALRLKKDDPQPHCNLGVALADKGQLDEAIAEYREALRLKKDYAEAHNNLGNALREKGQLDEAIAECREALRLKKDLPEAHYNLGNALREKGQLDEAIAECREALRLKKDDPKAHTNLGVALADKGQLDEAIAEYREALRLKKDLPEAHSNLGNALQDKGQLDEAIAEYREAIRLKRDLPEAHGNLGVVLGKKGQLDEAIACYREAIRLKRDLPEAHYNLGIDLRKKGQLDDAIACYREAIRLKKDYPEAHYNLGNALEDKGQLDDAITEYRQAIRLKKDYPEAHNNLGGALEDKGQLDDAIAEYRQAIRLKKDYPEAHYNLGIVLRKKGQLDDAIACYREAIRLKKDYPEAHCNLADGLRDKGQFAEALAAFRRGHELGSKDPRWPYPSAQWVRDCERLVELDRKLPAILKGEQQPADVAERLILADLCARYKRLYVAAARFYDEAFAEQPKAAADLRTGHRYNAACAAALAGCGQAEDASPLDEKEKARWRTQARDWLRADLALWQKQLDTGKPEGRTAVQQQLRHWQQDPDFKGVRDEAALAKLPEAEGEPWRKFWAEVEQTLAKTQAAPSDKAPPPPKD